jgi:PAS domain S-box-containing protein
MTEPVPETDHCPSAIARNGDAARTDVVCADLIGILDTVDLPVVVVGRNFTVSRFNRPAASALGLTASHLGQSPRGIGVFTDIMNLEELCAQVIADGVPCRREVRHGDRWFLLRIAPYTGGDGRIGGTVLTLTNVTALRASLEQAIHEREFTKAILNTVIEPLVVLDGELRVQSANRAFYAMFQVSRDQAHSVPLEALPNHAWKAPRLWPLLKETLCANKEFPTLEIEHNFPAIGRRTLLLDARPLCREGHPAPLLLLAFQDITERKRAEEALRESERHFREMIDALPAAVYTTDAQGRLTHFNPACIELSGRVPELGSDHWCVTWKLYHPDGTLMPEDECPMAIALNDGRNVRGTEAIAERPDGTRVWFMPYPTPLRDSEGHIVGGINMLVDITERKKTEDALRQSKETLTEADRRKDEFLAMLGHELRNPLAPIRNMLEILKQGDGHPDLMQQARATMDRQLGHMTRLIDDLLDVSRINRGRIELKLELVELASVIDQSIEACRPLADCAKHEVTVTLPSEPIHLHADPMRLAQVFGNLLNNACKYTEMGGRIGLSAELAGGGRQPREVVVTVKDSGMGIPPDKLDSIFGMFTQVDRTLERSQGGLGIGLTLAKRLVEMHGGSIQAFSDGADRGSEFVVRLPVLIDKLRKQHPAEPTRIEKEAPTGRRVLVVDDNPDGAASLAMLLKLAGNETYTAHDGVEAVKAAETIRPDVVFLDIGLPKLNGHDAARRIREQPWGTNMVLVALTGWGQDEDRRRSQEAGFDYHLVKPVDYADLNKLLASLPSGLGSELTSH